MWGNTVATPWWDHAWVPAYAYAMTQQATGCGGVNLRVAELLPMNIRNFKRQVKEGKYENSIRGNYLGRGFLMSLSIFFLFWGKEREHVQPSLEVK